MIEYEMMPHQKDAVWQSSFKPDLFLAWEMGTGKSCATINILRQRCAEEERLMKTIIFAPLIVLKNWKKEFDMFSKISQKAITVLEGPVKKRIEFIKNTKGPRIFITNYDALQNKDLLQAIKEWGPEILVADECFTPDVEVLTDRGFVRFDELREGTPLAQVCTETLEVDFVLPERLVVKDYCGPIIDVKSKNAFDFSATPGHAMLFEKEGSRRKVKLGALSLNSKHKLFVAGKAIGASDVLTDFEKLMIAHQADGNEGPSDRIFFSFTKERKVEEFTRLLNSMGIEYKEINDRVGRRRFSINVPRESSTKNIYDVIDYTQISQKKAKEIIEYMVLWDGYKASEDSYYYSSTDKNCVDFYQTVAILAGYRTTVSVQKDARKEIYSDVYRLFILKSSNYRTFQGVEKISREYRGKVYCATVPNGNIIIRRNGRPLIVGNCHSLKNPKSKRAKAVAEIADQCKHRYLLTGTPILNNAMDLYMQYRILDGYLGKKSTFGTNFFAFRAMYFEDENAAWSSKPGHFPKFIPRAATYKTFSKKIDDKTIRIKKSDVLKDLPPLVTEERFVEMSVEQRRAYVEMKRDFVTFVEAKLKEGEPQAVVAKLAITKALRLQEIVSGYAKTENGDVIRFKSVPRMDYLKEVLSDLKEDHKVIVWAVFKENYKMIAEACEELGIGYTEIHGDIPNKEKYANQDTFNNDPACRVLIGNPNAGGVGINLVASDYSLYYSRDFKLSSDLQSEARNWRKGSEIHEKITRINFITPGSIDELISEALQGKLSISEAIIDRVRDI